MKTLKTFLVWVLLLTLLPFVGETRAQNKPITNLMGLGSMTNAIQRSLKIITGIKVNVYQENRYGFIETDYDTDSYISAKTNRTWAAINNLYRGHLTKLASGALTNEFIDRDKPIKIWVYATINHPNPELQFEANYFHVQEEFKLVKKDGRYSLPDFSQKVLGLPANMLIEVPGAIGVKLVIERPFEGQLGSLSIKREVIDTRIEPSEYYDSENQALLIPMSWATNAYIKRAIVFTNELSPLFFNFEGNKVPEEPVLLTDFNSFVEEGLTTSSFRITGEEGRTLKVQYSEESVGPWIDTDIPEVTVPSYGSIFSYNHKSPRGFFRARVIPIPLK